MTEVVSNQHTIKVVRDHVGVDLLLKLAATRCLGPFMRTEHTLGSAAAELEMPASSLAYYVGRFVKAGLVQVAREQPRAGKPIPVYRSTADAFHVPFDAMPPGRRDEFLNGSRKLVLGEFTAAVDRAIMNEGGSGIRVLADPVRGVQIDFIDGSRASDIAATEWWGKLTLTDDEARRLSQELEDIVRRYSDDRPGPGKRSYIAMVGMVREGRRGTHRH
jgi:hypothetical protein